ncbi:MAG: NTP transferase domain-containing protein, partial [Candidatus Acidiferrales bacterium]
MIAVVILAAGESRRMGQPKALLPLPEKASAADSQSAKTAKTFLHHLVEVTRHPRAKILRVVVGAHEPEIRARVDLPDGSLVVNREWEKGQLSS